MKILLNAKLKFRPSCGNFLNFNSAFFNKILDLNLIRLSSKDHQCRNPRTTKSLYNYKFGRFDNFMSQRCIGMIRRVEN